MRNCNFNSTWHKIWFKTSKHFAILFQEIVIKSETWNLKLQNTWHILLQEIVIKSEIRDLKIQNTLQFYYQKLWLNQKNQFICKLPLTWQQFSSTLNAMVAIVLNFKSLNEVSRYEFANIHMENWIKSSSKLSFASMPWQQLYWTSKDSWSLKQWICKQMDNKIKSASQVIYKFWKTWIGQLKGGWCQYLMFVH